MSNLASNRYSTLHWNRRNIQNRYAICFLSYQFQYSFRNRNCFLRCKNIWYLCDNQTPKNTQIYVHWLQLTDDTKHVQQFFFRPLKGSSDLKSEEKIINRKKERITLGKYSTWRKHWAIFFIYKGCSMYKPHCTYDAITLFTI